MTTSLLAAERKQGTGASPVTIAESAARVTAAATRRPAAATMLPVLWVDDRPANNDDERPRSQRSGSWCATRRRRRRGSTSCSGARSARSSPTSAAARTAPSTSRGAEADRRDPEARRDHPDLRLRRRAGLRPPRRADRGGRARRVQPGRGTSSRTSSTPSRSGESGASAAGGALTDGPRSAASMWRIGIDVGGTFTDAVLVDDDGRMPIAKVRSTPGDISAGFLDALRRCSTRAGGRAGRRRLPGARHRPSRPTRSCSAGWPRRRSSRTRASATCSRSARRCARRVYDLWTPRAARRSSPRERCLERARPARRRAARSSSRSTRTDVRRAAAELRAAGRRGGRGDAPALASPNPAHERRGRRDPRRGAARRPGVALVARRAGVPRVRARRRRRAERRAAAAGRRLPRRALAGRSRAAGVRGAAAPDAVERRRRARPTRRASCRSRWPRPGRRPA